MKLTDLRKLISGYNADNTLKGTSKFTKQKIVDLLTLKFELVNNRLVLKSVTSNKGTVQLKKAPAVPLALQKALQTKAKNDKSNMASRIKDKVRASNSQSKTSNSWIEHVKSYAKKHDVSYREAMSKAKSSY